ncbi:hypothetical protein Droror1_Dr00018056 [Drosera rotundifolia]
MAGDEDSRDKDGRVQLRPTPIGRSERRRGGEGVKQLTGPKDDDEPLAFVIERTMWFEVKHGRIRVCSGGYGVDGVGIRTILEAGR